MKTASETSGITSNTATFALQGSEREDREKGAEKILEDIIAENFLSVGKEIVNKVQEAQRGPERINPRSNTPRYIVIKLTKIKDREKILKAIQEK